MLGNKQLEKRVLELEGKQKELERKCDRFIDMIANLTAEIKKYETEIHDATEDMYKNRSGLYDRRALHRNTQKYLEDEEGIE